MKTKLLASVDDFLQRFEVFSISGIKTIENPKNGQQNDVVLLKGIEIFINFKKKKLHELNHNDKFLKLTIFKKKMIYKILYLVSYEKVLKNRSRENTSGDKVCVLPKYKFNKFINNVM